MRSNLRSKQLALKLKLSNLISKVFYPDGFIRRDFLFGFLLKFLYQKLGNYGLAYFIAMLKYITKRFGRPFKGRGCGQSPQIFSAYAN